MSAVSERTRAFCSRFGLGVPILLAPMAGACPPGLAAAVANAGGMGSCGALLLQPDQICAWVGELRGKSNGSYMLNLWIPDPPPARDPEREAAVRTFLASWGPEIGAAAGDVRPPDFLAQCETLLELAPPVASSIMGLFPPDYVQRLKARGIAWFATVTTVAEAKQAAAAGADVIVAQGAEAGGHRGAFCAADAASRLVGLFSLLPAVVDAVEVPVVAAGGIADARGVAAALLLGASAVAVGTGFLRSPEAQLPPAWAAGLAAAAPEDTVVHRAFSGRPGRSLANAYVRAAIAVGAPAPAPYPVQRGLTAPMRSAAAAAGDVDRMQAWAGQSSALAQALPAAEIVERLWTGARALLAEG